MLGFSLSDGIAHPDADRQRALVQSQDDDAKDKVSLFVRDELQRTHESRHCNYTNNRVISSRFLQSTAALLW